MMQTTAALSASAQTPGVSPGIDIMDLVHALLEARQPDRFLDRCVDMLVLRRRFDETLTASKFRFGNWLPDEIPTFTAGAAALNLLATKLGYRVKVLNASGEFHAVAWSVKTQVQVRVKGHIEGTAGVLALVRLAMLEEGKQSRTATYRLTKGQP